jgi:Spy/CpxP family protein refolding chaperone
MKIIPPFTRLVAAALLLCAVFGAARAGEAYEPPAAANELILVPPRREVEREGQAARELDERRQKMMDECEQNHGSEKDCERETDTELRAEGRQSGARVIHLAPPR